MFRATNFTITLLLLGAFTFFIMFVRNRKPLENSWPLLYWLLVVFFTLVRPEETFNLGILLVGLACGLLLRFEFMNRTFINMIKFIEMGVWVYVLLQGTRVVLHA